jgi:hypothetical protein
LDMRSASALLLLMTALLGTADDAAAFEARAGQRKRERTILACVVVAAAVVLIPTAVGSACGSGRCREGTSASAGAADEDVGVAAAPPSKTRTAANATATTSHAPATANASLHGAAPSMTSSSSPPTKSPTYLNSTSSSTSPPTAPETSLEDWQEMQALTASIQPRVTVVEGRPAHRGIASISSPGTLVIVICFVLRVKKCAVKPGGRAQLIRTKTAYILPAFTLANSLPIVGAFRLAGTPWCDGGPTFWVTGHQKIDESPFCLYDGRWTLNNNTALDSEDVLNLNTIDRHYCVTMDVNRDGRDDVLCNVGASKGKGEGFNELYITQPDGSLLKIQVRMNLGRPGSWPRAFALTDLSSTTSQSGHGLQKYPTMRNRRAVTLRDGSGAESLVLFTTLGTPRSDGRPDGEFV